MDGTENIAKESYILWTLFEFDEILIQPREVFMTFDQKLTNRLLILCAQVVHGPFLIPGGELCPARLLKFLLMFPCELRLSAFLLDDFTPTKAMQFSA